jgi:hypothetical protein
MWTRAEALGGLRQLQQQVDAWANALLSDVELLPGGSRAQFAGHLAVPVEAMMRVLQPLLGRAELTSVKVAALLCLHPHCIRLQAGRQRVLVLGPASIPLDAGSLKAALERVLQDAVQRWRPGRDAPASGASSISMLFFLETVWDDQAGVSVRLS